MVNLVHGCADAATAGPYTNRGEVRSNLYEAPKAHLSDEIPSGLEGLLIKLVSLLSIQILNHAYCSKWEGIHNNVKISRTEHQHLFVQISLTEVLKWWYEYHQIIHLNRIFHYKPCLFRVPPWLWKPPLVGVANCAPSTGVNLQFLWIPMSRMLQVPS